MSFTSEDLPEPLTPVTAVKVPSGKSTSTPSEVVGRGALDGDHALGIDRATALWDFDLLAPREVVAGQRARVLQEIGVAAGVHDGAAVDTRPGADVDDPVGGADGVFVVLDDDERVAQVAQRDERVDEPPVVALVQADARLVEHVEHPREAGADLGRQADALCLTARERGRRAGEVEVAEPDPDQEVEADLDLAQHLGRDGLLALGELGADP